MVPAVVPDTGGHSFCAATKATRSIRECGSDSYAAGTHSEAELVHFITRDLSEFRNNFYYSHFLKKHLCQVEHNVIHNVTDIFFNDGIFLRDR